MKYDHTTIKSNLRRHVLERRLPPEKAVFRGEVRGFEPHPPKKLDGILKFPIICDIFPYGSPIF